MSHRNFETMIVKRESYKVAVIRRVVNVLEGTECNGGRCLEGAGEICSNLDFK